MSSEITINSNIASLQTQRRLGASSSSLTRIFERLSSGQRITRASDDAAGLAISDSLLADGRVFAQGVRNLNDGISLLSIGEGALSELTNIVTRVRELAEQAANGTLGNRQRAALDKEAQQLSKEYTRIAQTAEFNGIKLFDGSTSSLRLQSGYGALGGVLASIGGAKGDGTFAQRTSQNLTTDVYGAAAGDLNGDGISDIVFSEYGGVIEVQIGNGDGTFKSLHDIASYIGTNYDLALGDVNGDGVLDIVSTGYSSFDGYTYVRIGNGDGTFSLSASYIGGVQGRGVELADLNGDGYADMVSAVDNSGTGGAYVWINDGTGGYGASTYYAMEGVASYDVALSDINNDGIVDMITTGYGAGTGRTTVRLGNGNGSFKIGVSYLSEGNYSNSVSLGDLNNDGYLDLITAGLGGSAGQANVRLSLKDGTFGSLTSYMQELTQTEDVLTADMNGDGNLDLVTVGVGDAEGMATIRLGNGNGTFGAAASYQSNQFSTTCVTAGDFNNDGVLDLITGGQNGQGESSVLLAVPGSGVSALLPFSLKNQASAKQAMGDLDRSLKRISAHRGYLGAFQSRVASALNSVSITIESYSAAESQIRDADVATEAANLAKGTILQRAAATILAQANQEPQIALSLLQGVR